MTQFTMAAFCVLLAISALGCTSDEGDDEPIAVVIDTDMGIDDVRALMLLLDSDEVEIRAVTVTGSGLARCPQAAVTAAALLRSYGKDDVPVACGSRSPLDGFNTAPTAWRDQATLLAGMDLDRSGLADTIREADTLLRDTLRDTLRENDQLVILALGPLTNIAPVLRDPALAEAVAEVRIMGGAVDVGGNILSFTNFAPEFNIWIDPTAAQQVLESGVAISIIPLDATNAVPISPATIEAFRSGTTRSSELLNGFYGETPLQGGLYHWDDLAAATLIDPSLVEFKEIPIAITTDQQSSELGRTARVEQGDGVVARVAVSADRDRFEQMLFQRLAGFETTTSESWVPEATITFDGERCAYDGPEPPPADLELQITNNSSAPALGVIFGVYDPGTTLQQASDFAAAGLDRPPGYFTLISVAPLPTQTTSIWVVRDLPSDITISCAITPSDVHEVAGVRLPT